MTISWLIALDFDMTISKNHCNGDPMANPPSNADQIRDTINRWQREGHLVVLVTRAIKEQITGYMKLLGLNIPIYAPSREKFDKYQGILYWSIYKCKCLARIRKKYNTRRIIFIDDTLPNILCVKENLKDIITIHAVAGDVNNNVAAIDAILRA